MVYYSLGERVMMKKILKKIKKILLSITREQREKKTFDRYNVERKRLESLPERVLSSRYVYLKSKYEYHKNIFSLFIGTILIGVLTGAGKFSYNLTVKGMQVIYHDSLNVERDKTSILIIVSLFFIFIVIVVLLILLIYLRELYLMRKTLLIMEEIRKEKRD